MSRNESLLGILFLSFVLACTPAFAAVAPASDNSSLNPVSQQETNKAVARRVFEEIFNKGNFQVANEIYARDFVNHGLHRDAGLEEDQAAAHWEKQAFPDLTMTVDLMVADGDLVAVVWRASGTNTASASPLPPTRVKIEMKGITVWRIVDGRIREEWTAFDLLRVVRQFADQLKWKLLGILCAVASLFWAAGRGIRRLRRAYSTAG